MDNVSRDKLRDAMSKDFTTYIRLGQREKAEEVKSWLERIRAGEFSSSESEGEASGIHWKSVAEIAQAEADRMHIEYRRELEISAQVVQEREELIIENERLRAELEGERAYNKQAARALREAEADNAEADAWCEYWRREAFRQHPTQDAYEAACKGLWKHREDNVRLRSTLRLIKAEELMTKMKKTNVYRLADEALEGSTSETAVQPEQSETAAKTARERIAEYIAKSGYTYTVDDIVEAYMDNFKNGWYVSHTTRDCIENLTPELEEICSGIKDGREEA